MPTVNIVNTATGSESMAQLSATRQIEGRADVTRRLPGTKDFSTPPI